MHGVSAEETVDSTPNRETVSFDESAYSNMLTLNALVELLGEKGLMATKEIRQRAGRPQSRTKESSKAC